MRLEFINFWNSLSTHARSIIISLTGIFLAVGTLQAAKTIFPGANFSSVEYAITTGIMAFIANVLKESIISG